MYRKILKNDEKEYDPCIAEVENQCRNCIHWEMKSPMVCAAFPEGIPLAIYLGLDHSNPYIVDGKVGDGGLMYESRDNTLTNVLDGGSIS